MYTTTASFTFQNNQAKEDFLQILRGRNGLSITRGWEGCLDVKLYTNNDNENQVFIVGNWEEKKNHESYLEMRKETGLLGQIVSTLEGGESGLDIRNYSTIRI